MKSRHRILSASFAASSAAVAAAGPPAPSLQEISEGRCQPTSIPEVSLVLHLDGCPIDIDPLSCGEVVPLADGFFHFFGRYEVADLGSVRWSLRVDPDPFIIGTLVVTNTSMSTQLFFLQLGIPATLSGPTVIGGSVSGSVSDGSRNGAELAAPLGSSVYYAVIDNVPVAAGTLLADPYVVSVPPFETASIGPASFGAPIPSEPFGAVASSIGLSIQFTLTARDTASLTSIFVVEPAPPLPAPAPIPDSPAQEARR